MFSQSNLSTCASDEAIEVPAQSGGKVGPSTDRQTRSFPTYKHIKSVNHVSSQYGDLRITDPLDKIRQRHESKIPILNNSNSELSSDSDSESVTFKYNQPNKNQISKTLVGHAPGKEIQTGHTTGVKSDCKRYRSKNSYFNFSVREKVLLQ